MNRRRIIVTITGFAILLALCALVASRFNRDVSNVHIGFSGYALVSGTRSLMLVVTNGSSYQISQPNGDYDLSGLSDDQGSMTSSRGNTISCCGFVKPSWGLWQLQLPKIQCIAPGETFQFSIPVEKGPYTWRVTVPFTRIPFKDRLPYLLRSHWPSFIRDTPTSFEITSPSIPPDPTELSNTGSTVESSGIRK